MNRDNVRSCLAGTAIAALAVAWPYQAQAVEGGVGRSLTAAQILPNAGIIPPTPGWVAALVALHYDGKMEAIHEVPIGGESALGLEAKVTLPALSLLYVWDTGPGHWNYASGVIVPYNSSDVSVTTRIGSAQTNLSDSVHDWFDLGFIPIQASYHVSKTEHIGLGVTVYAPTARYVKGKLANAGLNVWTVSPAVSYTNYVGKTMLELSGIWGLDFYSKNEDTGYTNGIVSRLDVLALQRLPSGFGFGLVGGWLEQLTDDKGATADRLGGFKSRSVGVGPLLSYATKVGGKHLEMTFRWVREFDVRNRPEGDVYILSGTLAF